MAKLPDSLFEKLVNVPVEEVLTMLEKPENIKKLNLNFFEYMSLIEYITDIANSAKDVSKNVEDLKSENKKLKTQLAYQEARCEELENKLESIGDVLNGYEEDYN